MADMSLDLVREIGGVKAEVSGLKVEVAGVRERIDDLVIAQLRDHGKRLALLENRLSFVIGAALGAGGLSGSVAAVLVQVFH